ncbi:hypothetical protein F511_14704 [Dorcoceras hygrometricum]|uniref:Dystroglycan-like n=1 Tax=Dorcoceras hygrometricum TaxID=472368 RepID=A0A2Z7BJB1_9LAMI|nr:hypothetical protein F511_14704 [Dorcoceras hygrometricum]
MASSSFTNAYLVDFDYVLEIPDNEGMQKMFKALETSGLRGFLGCKPVLYQSELGQFFDTALVQDEDITGAISGKYFTVTPSRFNEGMQKMFKALETSGLRGFLGCKPVLYQSELGQFFDTALVQDEDITGAISGKYFTVTPSRFAGVFELPTEGISNFSDVPKNKVYDARRIFSKSGEHVDTHGKKKFLKYEYRLLNDILAKSITVKAGSFDAVTNERFQMMTAIHFGLKINWGKVLFSVLKEMVDRTVKKAKGFGAQIFVLLNSDPVLLMGNATSFPSSKILSPKVFLAYISSNEIADARGQSKEGGKSPVAVVKRASKSKKKSESSSDAPVEIVSEIIGSKKRPASASDEPAITKRKRTSKGKPSSSQSSTVSIVQGAVPLQVIEPTPAETVKQPPVSQRQTRRRRVILSTVSEDEDEEDTENVKNVSHVSRQVEPPIDDVDVIISQVISQTTGLTADELEQEGQRIDEPEIGDDVDQWFEGSFQDFDSRVDEQMELMSIDDLLLQISDDMMLPSITAAEISKLRIGESIVMPDKGKGVLVEDEPVKGNPAREIVELICGDVELLVQLRERVMKDVVDLFHYFSLKKLPKFDALKELKEKEKLMLEWAVTDSLEMAVKRKMYILADYRELLLRKFLDSSRRYTAPGQPWTTIVSQIVDLLSVVHSKSLEDLIVQQKEHCLVMERPCSSTFLTDSTDDSGVVLAQFYSVAKYACWCQEPWLNKILSRTGLIEAVQYWEAAPSLTKTWAWQRVCTEVILFSVSGCLRPASCFTDIVVANLGIERLPDYFLDDFDQGVHSEYFVDFLSDSSVQSDSEIDSESTSGNTVYRSPSPADNYFALGRVIFTSAQEELLYSVEFPDSSPPTSQRQESTSSASGSPLSITPDDVPLKDHTEDNETSLPTTSTDLSSAVDDIKSFLAQSIADSENNILHKIQVVINGLRDNQYQQQDFFRTQFHNSRQDIHNDVNTLFVHISGGSAVRTPTFPPTVGTFAERVAMAQRHILESGQVISIEEAAERVIEADRRESDRLERERARERRERRLRRRGL